MAKEYIEREKALQAVNEFYHDPKIDIVLKAIPSAEVREIKNCTECKHQTKKAGEYPCSQCVNWYIDKFEPKTKQPNWQSAIMRTFLGGER